MSELTLKYEPRPGQLKLHEAMAEHRFGVAVAKSDKKFLYCAACNPSQFWHNHKKLGGFNREFKGI